MICPAIYITYLISSAVPAKQRIKHLIISTVVLVVISLSWAVTVDLIPSQNRPFVGSSTNNTIMELILGHNGLERLSRNSGGMGGGFNAGSQGQMRNFKNKSNDRTTTSQNNIHGNNHQGMTPPSGWQQNSKSHQNMPEGPDGQRLNNSSPGSGGPSGANGLSGNFGGQTQSGFTRLFSKNVLSDQIIWFLPLSFLGFIAAAIVEKLKFPFNDKKKLDLILWIAWLVPEFIYFSFTKGLFHQYYLTMMAPPIAALSGIGLTSMWKLYKQSGIKSWLLPISFIVEGLVNLLMLSYFNTIPTTIKYMIITAIVLCFASSIFLILYKAAKKKSLNSEENKINFSKIFTAIALIGILTTPAIGSAATLTHSVNGTMPAAGLELLTNGESDNRMIMGRENNTSNQKLIKFLDSHVTNEKYALVVSSSTSAEGIILESGKSIMALGGFSGSDKILNLNQFKEIVKKGEVRYVLTGGIGGRDSEDIMNWVQKNGKVVSESEWKETNNYEHIKNPSNSNNTKSNTKDQNSRFAGMGVMNNETLYDLKDTVK